MSKNIVDFVKDVISKTSKYEDVVNILKEILVSKYDFSEKYLASNNFVSKYPTIYSMVKSKLVEGNEVQCKKWKTFSAGNYWPSTSGLSSYIKNNSTDKRDYSDYTTFSIDSIYSFIELNVVADSYHYITIDCANFSYTVNPCIFFILESNSIASKKVEFKIQYINSNGKTPFVIFLDKNKNYINPSHNMLPNGLIVNNSVNINGEDFYLVHSKSLENTFGLDEYLFVKSNEHVLLNNTYIEDWSEPFSKSLYTNFGKNDEEIKVLFHNSTWNIISNSTNKPSSLALDVKNAKFNNNSILDIHDNKLHISTRNNISGIFGQTSDFEKIDISNPGTYTSTDILKIDNSVAKVLTYPDIDDNSKIIYVENWNDLKNWNILTGSIITTNAVVRDNTVTIDNRNGVDPRHGVITSKYSFEADLAPGENIGYFTEIKSANFYSNKVDSFIYPVWDGSCPNYFILKTTNNDNEYTLTSSDCSAFSLMDYGAFTLAADIKIHLPIRIAQFIRNNAGIRETRAIVIDTSMVSVADSGWVSSGLPYAEGDTTHRLAVHNRSYPCSVTYGAMYFYKNLTDYEITNISQFMQNNLTVKPSEPTIKYSGYQNIPYFKKDIFNGPLTSIESGLYYKFDIEPIALGTNKILMYTGHFNTKCRAYIKIDSNITVSINDKVISIANIYTKYSIHFGIYFHMNQVFVNFAISNDSNILVNTNTSFGVMSEAEILLDYDCDKKQAVWSYWKPFIQTIMIDDIDNSNNSILTISPIIFKYNLKYTEVLDYFNDITNTSTIKIYDSLYNSELVEHAQKYIRLSELNNLILAINDIENATHRISLIYDKNDTSKLNINKNYSILSDVNKPSIIEDIIDPAVLTCEGYVKNELDYFEYQSSKSDATNTSIDLLYSDIPNVANSEGVLDTFNCVDYEYEYTDEFYEYVKETIYGNIRYFSNGKVPTFSYSGDKIIDISLDKDYNYNMVIDFSDIKSLLDTMNFSTDEGFYYVFKYAYVGDTSIIKGLGGDRDVASNYKLKIEPNDLALTWDTLYQSVNLNANTSINWMSTLLIETHYLQYAARLGASVLNSGGALMNFDTTIAVVEDTYTKNTILDKSAVTSDTGELIYSKFKPRLSTANSDDIIKVHPSQLVTVISPIICYGYDVTNIVEKYVNNTLTKYNMVIYNNDLTNYFMPSVPLASQNSGQTQEFWTEQMSEMKGNLVLYFEKRKVTKKIKTLNVPPPIIPTKVSGDLTTLPVNDSILSNVDLSTWRILNKYRVEGDNV